MVELPTPSAYRQPDLLAKIRLALGKLDITPQQLSAEQLAALDEFHLGGRKATTQLMAQLALMSAHRVLDVGCGLGGAARFCQASYGCQITGLDVTAQYVEVGNVLCQWLNQHADISLRHGSALDMPFTEAAFDRAYMMHVGMNIDEKLSLFREIYRVLKPGAKFLLYDVMRLNGEALRYPVPWSESEQDDHCAPVELYQQALQQAGFSIESESSYLPLALEFLQRAQQKMSTMAAPPALGLHLLLGEQAPVKLHNMQHNLNAGVIAPVAMLLSK